MCPHEVQFYENDAFLVTRVTAFVSAALAAGESVVVIATPAHRAAFTERLERNGIDTRQRFIALDASQTLAQFMIDDWPDAERFTLLMGAIIAQATDGGVLKLHAFGEMVALLCADGKPQAALRLETLWNRLARRHPFSLLCAYPAAVFDAVEQSSLFDAICSAHSHVSPCEAYQLAPAALDNFHRTIAKLQHRAQLLEREIIRRKEAERAISRLAAHQEHIREDERQRIAREIHDELGGLLTGIKAYLAVAIDQTERAGLAAAPDLIDAADQANSAIETVRRVITDLRPSVLDHLGVWAAIEWYAGQIAVRTGLRCEWSVDAATAASVMDPDRSIALFRIVQEALTNVVRHGKASHVSLRATRHDDVVMIEVEDNGRGIATERLLNGDSWGIVGMHERARNFGGELKITGSAGHGTVVTVWIPMKETDDSAQDQRAAGG